MTGDDRCSVEGCFHVVRNLRRRLCNKHYQRQLRHGDTAVNATVRFVPKFRGRPQP